MYHTYLHAREWPKSQREQISEEIATTPQHSENQIN